MKTTIKRPVEIEIATVKLKLPVRYEEEEIPNDFPFREGDLWEAEINVDTGKILNWPQGKPADMFLTVKDTGYYELFDPAGRSLAKIDDNYVPHGLIPGEYGDVVLFTIDATGTITNWPIRPDVSEFFPEDD